MQFIYIHGGTSFTGRQRQSAGDIIRCGCAGNIKCLEICALIKCISPPPDNQFIMTRLGALKSDIIERKTVHK